MTDLNFGAATQKTIEIEASANNGFLVSIGSEFFVFENVDGMLDLLTAYLKNPDDTRAQFEEKNDYEGGI